MLISCGKSYSSVNLSVCDSVKSTRQSKNIDGFSSRKNRVLPKKPSSSGNVCIRYLHLVVRRERAHDLHSKAKRLRISCKKNFNFSELSFTVLSRELSAHAWCLFSCRPLQVTVKYYVNVIYIRV